MSSLFVELVSERMSCAPVSLLVWVILVCTSMSIQKTNGFPSALKYMSMRMLEHRTLVSNDSLSESAQYLRAVSSWCEEFGPKPNEREPTSERFTMNENEQILKEVKPQKVN